MTREALAIDMTEMSQPCWHNNDRAEPSSRANGEHFSGKWSCRLYRARQCQRCLDCIISCASRASWLGTPQGIDLSVITRAVGASEKLHPEVLSFKDRSDFVAQRSRGLGEGGEKYSVRELYYSPEIEEQIDIDSMQSINRCGGLTLHLYEAARTHVWALTRPKANPLVKDTSGGATMTDSRVSCFPSMRILSKYELTRFYKKKADQWSWMTLTNWKKYDMLRWW